MIFCIADDVIDSIIKCEESFPEEKLTRQLTAIVNSDFNILTVESNLIIETIKEIIKSTVVNEFVKKVFLKCHKDFSQIFDITKKVTTRIIITLSENSIDYGSIRLSLDYLEKNNISIGNAINLMSEDVSDCKFYDDLARVMNNEISEGVEVKFRYTSGAGQVLSKNLNTALQQNGDIVFVVCDSDKKFPHAVYGDTAKYLEQKQRELTSKGIFHFATHILEVHEKENLLIPKEYNKLLKPQHIELFLKIERSSEFFDYLIFYDYKVGVTKKVMLRDDGAQYFEKLFLEFPELRNGKDLDTLTEKESISHSLGRKCLDNFDVNCLEKEPKTKIEQYRKALSLIIWSWGISLGRQLVM